MSGTLPAGAVEIVQSIDEDIGSLEERLSGTAEHLLAKLTQIEQQRSEIISALEEHELERSLAGLLDDAAFDPDYGESLRQREEELSDAYSGYSTLHRQLNGFVHLLTASREQFRARSELPGISDAQRMAIRHAMIQSQEDERRRLAREIHDGPAQVLANAIIGLEFIGRSLQLAGDASETRALHEIERVKSSMREGLTEIRRFIFDLRPTMLSQRGLAATVEHYIQTYRHLFPGEVELEIPGDLPRLTPDQEMTAFRVIQESLQNVHRHSRSTRTRVAISVKADSLKVEIRDNGQGFRPTAITPSLSGGFGLAGMRERAEVIGASLTVRSSPGEGTDVLLSIPLHSRGRRSAGARSHRSGVDAQGGTCEPGADPGR